MKNNQLWICPICGSKTDTFRHLYAKVWCINKECGYVLREEGSKLPICTTTASMPPVKPLKKEPIVIELVRNNDINANAEFLEAQKMLLSFVPKNKVGLLYKGLKSKLQYSIDRYVDSNSTKRMESIAEEYKAAQRKLSERINYLEQLCEGSGIKHKLTRDDVYSKRKDGFVND